MQDYSRVLRLLENRKCSTFGGRNQILYFFERTLVLLFSVLNYLMLNAVD